MDKEQREIDWDWVSRERLLDAALIPTCTWQEGTTRPRQVSVTSDKIKHCLRIIGRFQVCWLSQFQIATRAGFVADGESQEKYRAKRTMKRIMKALELLDLVVVEPHSGGRSNRTRVNWTALATLDPTYQREAQSRRRQADLGATRGPKLGPTLGPPGASLGPPGAHLGATHGPLAIEQEESRRSGPGAGAEFLKTLEEHRIAPAPFAPADMAHGIFGPLRDDDLVALPRVVAWYRLQLRTPRPLTTIDGRGCELLRVCAAAEFAAGMPATAVRRSRTAVFASIVGGGRWADVDAYCEPALWERALQAAELAAAVFERRGDARSFGDLRPNARRTQIVMDGGAVAIIRTGRAAGSTDSEISQRLRAELPEAAIPEGW